jgi:hypothetical protein
MNLESPREKKVTANEKHLGPSPPRAAYCPCFIERAARRREHELQLGQLQRQKDNLRSSTLTQDSWRHGTMKRRFERYAPTYAYKMIAKRRVTLGFSRDWVRPQLRRKFFQHFASTKG